MLVLLFLLLIGALVIIKNSIVYSMKGVALLLKICFSLIGALLLFAGGLVGAVFGMVILIGCGIHLLARI
ncbi:MAG: hypothetical protein IJ801_05300 [Lachnospiraceae bacterium]|nr:hypothetical protein [Lachnospiraceae bacterium]